MPLGVNVYAGERNWRLSVSTALGNLGAPLTAALGADVALNNTATWFDGASVAQGTSGIWFVVAHATFTNASTNINPNARLYDGTNVYDSARSSTWVANAFVCITLHAIVTNPAGNLRIQGNDPQFTTSVMKFNGTGQSKDTSISAVRIG